MNRRFKGKTCAMLCMMLVLSALPFVGCHKEPTVEPTKTITFDIDWGVDTMWAPSIDTLKYYTKQADVKYVYINLVNKGPSGGGMHCDGYTPNIFHMAREGMEPCFKISDKVKGSGTIIVNRVGGAQLPDLEHGVGMAEVDSIWFASKGFTVKRLGAKKSK